MAAGAPSSPYDNPRRNSATLHVPSDESIRDVMQGGYVLLPHATFWQLYGYLLAGTPLDQVTGTKVAGDWSDFLRQHMPELFTDTA